MHLMSHKFSWIFGMNNFFIHRNLNFTHSIIFIILFLLQKFLEKNGRDLENRKQLIVLRKRIAELETENNELRIKLAEALKKNSVNVGFPINLFCCFIIWFLYNSSFLTFYTFFCYVRVIYTHRRFQLLLCQVNLHLVFHQTTRFHVL